jgi:DNA-binding FrmR family transcriptional regulator
MDSRRFARTQKGHDEIVNQRKTLKGKLRTILFLIDPAKPLDAIQQQVALMGGSPDALAQLVAEGYIAEVGGAGASVAPAVSATDDELASFRVAKAFMNDAIVDALGMRAFVFTLRLERCVTRADLATLLPDYTQALAKKLDKNAALALVERTRELLGHPRR